jgi:hypothetical protein
LLTRKGTEALLHVERILDDAVHEGAPSGSPGSFDRGANAGDGRTSTFATAAGRDGSNNSRGQ